MRQLIGHPFHRGEKRATVKPTITANADFLRNHLEHLGIRRQAEWDVLAFIYVHGASLAGSEHLARLVGHRKGVVEAALVSLSAAGLIVRSRNSRGIRMHRIGSRAVDDSRRVAMEALIAVGEDRGGRLLIIGHLAGNVPAEELRERSGLHLA